MAPLRPWRLGSGEAGRDRLESSRTASTASSDIAASTGASPISRSPSHRPATDCEDPRIQPQLAGQCHPGSDGATGRRTAGVPLSHQSPLPRTWTRSPLACSSAAAGHESAKTWHMSCRPRNRLRLPSCNSRHAPCLAVSLHTLMDAAQHQRLHHPTTTSAQSRQQGASTAAVTSTAVISSPASGLVSSTRHLSVVIVSPIVNTTPISCGETSMREDPC